MQERIARAQNLFYLGLLVMLGTAVASAATGTGIGSALLIGMTLTGAVTALLAKIRLAQLQRTVRHRGPLTGVWATR